MHHIAIMNKSWDFIPKILLGDKSIESRWYQTRRAPWNMIKAGDTVYFKNSGEAVTARAEVSKVLQFQLGDIADAEKIIKNYGKNICLVNNDPKTWGKKLKYCILIFLENPTQIRKPFAINKKGFGNSTAWITVKNISLVRVAI